MIYLNMIFVTLFFNKKFLIRIRNESVTKIIVI